MIEKGRHLRSHMERNNRKCYHGVEDEKHFVMNCPQYDEEHTSVSSL